MSKVKSLLPEAKSTRFRAHRWLAISLFPFKTFLKQEADFNAARLCRSTRCLLQPRPVGR